MLQPLELQLGEEAAAALRVGHLVAAERRADRREHLACALVRYGDEHQVLDVQRAAAALLEHIDDVAPRNEAAEAVGDDMHAVVAPETRLHERIELLRDLVDSGIRCAAAAGISKAGD